MRDDKEVIRLVTNSLSDICRKTEGTLIGAFVVGDAAAGVITGRIQDPDRAPTIANAIGSAFGGYLNSTGQHAAAIGVDFDAAKETLAKAVVAAFAAGVEEIVKSGVAAQERKGSGQPYPTREAFEQRLVHTSRSKNGGRKS